MNQGRDSKYIKSIGDVEEGFVRRVWTPPRSCPWPVNERDAWREGIGSCVIFGISCFGSTISTGSDG